MSQLLGRAVDLLHLCLVEADQRAVERLVVAVEVMDESRTCLGRVSDVSRTCLGRVSEVSRKCLGGV